MYITSFTKGKTLRIVAAFKELLRSEQIFLFEFHHFRSCYQTV